MSNLPGDPPSGTRNGKPTDAKPGLESEEYDHRVVYAVVGGIALAFLLGIVLLIVSALADWAD